jgi:hypothetical protein
MRNGSVEGQTPIGSDDRADARAMTRRDAAAAIVGALGVATLAGCDAASPIDDSDLSYLRQAATGTNLQWADSVAELSSLNGNTYKVAVLTGYYGPADGGGGVFRWASSGTPNWGTVLAGSGGCWKRIHSGPLSIRWFGADGTLAHDTQAIQRAINALGSAGGTVYVPEGTWLVEHKTDQDLGTDASCALQISNPNVRLTGPGTLKRGTTASVITLFIKGTLTLQPPSFSPVKNVTVDGLTFDGARSNPSQTGSSAIKLLYAEECTVRDTQIRDCAGSGIDCYNSSRCRFVNNSIANVFDNGIFAGIADPTISTDHLEANYNIISGNRIDGTKSQNCIYLTASSNGNIDCGAVGIYDNVVTNNVCLNPFDTGIEVGQGCIHTIVANNQVHSASRAPLLLRDCQYTVVEGNTIVSNQRSYSGDTDAIAVMPLHRGPDFAYHAVISGNVVKGGFKRSAIYVQGSYVQVSSNRCEEYLCVRDDGNDLNGWGILLCDGVSRVVVTDNDVSGFVYGVMTGDGGNRAYLNDIVIRGNRIHQVQIGVSLFRSTLCRSQVCDNDIHQIRDLGIDAQETVANNDSTVERNRLFLYGYTSTPVAERHASSSGWMFGPTRTYVVPTALWAGISILAPEEFHVGFLLLEFDAGLPGEDPQYAFVEIWPANGTGNNVGYSVLRASPRIHDNLTQGDWWGMTKDASGLYFCRCGLDVTLNTCLRVTRLGAVAGWAPAATWS